jgi:ribonuclease G
MLCVECSVCGGRGVVKSVETICYEIFREIMRDSRDHENDTLVVLASRAVVDCMLGAESASVADLEAAVGNTISFRVEPEFTQEQFDIVVL